MIAAGVCRLPGFSGHSDPKRTWARVTPVPFNMVVYTSAVRFDLTGAAP